MDMYNGSAQRYALIGLIPAHHAISCRRSLAFSANARHTSNSVSSVWSIENACSSLPHERSLDLMSSYYKGNHLIARASLTRMFDRLYSFLPRLWVSKKRTSFTPFCRASWANRLQSIRKVAERLFVHIKPGKRMGVRILGEQYLEQSAGFVGYPDTTLTLWTGEEESVIHHTLSYPRLQCQWSFVHAFKMKTFLQGVRLWYTRCIHRHWKKLHIFLVAWRRPIQRPEELGPTFI